MSEDEQEVKTTTTVEVTPVVETIRVEEPKTETTKVETSDTQTTTVEREQPQR